jgi:phosphate transport system substrate-binding protein
MPPHRRHVIASVILALAAMRAGADDLSDLPTYRADTSVYGEIRNWGNDLMLNVLRLWEVGFHEHQRGVRFADVLFSTAAAIGPLYTGVADLGILGRQAVPIETQAFHRAMGYDALEIKVAMGAYDVDSRTPGIVVFVNSRNPISKLTLEQLDGMLGSQRTGGFRGRRWSAESARGAAGNIRTWGQLGLTGEWADKPINVYGFDLSVNGFAFALQRKVFKGGDTWNPGLREFPLTEPGRAGARPKVGAHAMIEALAQDPYGIAYSAIHYGRGNPAVKPVALAETVAGPYTEPTKENFVNRTYPLHEPICIYVDRPPGKAVDPKVREFLRYILSRQGQKDIVDGGGGYLPLNAQEIRAERQKLE